MHGRGLFLVFWCSLTLGLAGRTSHAQEKPATPEALRFFETSIRPLLIEHCHKCHGEKKQKADLRLDAREYILKGGPSGPAAIPGQPEKSLLIKAVRHIDPELKMPQEMKLSDRAIADLTRWVQMGLPFPGAAGQKAAVDSKNLWAFQKVKEPTVPAVKDTAWPQSPLDHFILTRLEAKGLKPAAAADRRTLIRRATFDLIGLPPTPEEIDAFLKDAQPNAFAKVVDRLLASPHYGERWGRHWLDVARYADSNGLDENIAFGNAWRYRDFVVQAFNDDLPFDQFLVEQLAGDLLPTEDPALRQRRLIATGFLALGPKVLAEVDEKKMEMDIVDEQIDTVGRAFLGLTIGCARCHDHKFDPLPTSDYYGLAGIFQSTRTMEHFKKIARWHENPLVAPKDAALLAAHQQELTQRKDAIAAWVRQAQEKLQSAMPPGTILLKIPEALFPAATKTELKRLRDDLALLEKNGPAVPTAMGVAEGRTVDAPIHPRGNHLKKGQVVARRVPQALAGEQSPSFPPKQSGRLELARWLTQPDHPLTGRVLVNRVWRWHFGQGIVHSVDNFGALGELPENQPLLDWLAKRFVEKGWSIKELQRRIMLSSTYQMSAVADPKAREIDPENRLQGRANVRRLEAEAIRDALLAAGGVLDKSMGGSMLHVKNREFLFDHTSRDLTKYDSRRRSLYLPVIRNNVYDVFQLFDFPDPAVPNGDRATTTIAPQALFMMNSDWTMKVCDAWAAALLKNQARGDEGRVRQVYRTAYGRDASTEETAKALGLLGDLERALRKNEANPERRRLLAWSSWCQVVVSANEFIYVQ